MHITGSVSSCRKLFSETCDARALPLVGSRSESVWKEEAGEEWSGAEMPLSRASGWYIPDQIVLSGLQPTSDLADLTSMRRAPMELGPMSASTVCRKHAALFPLWSLTWPTARNFHWWLPSKRRYDGDASDGVCSGVGGKGAMAQAVTAQGRLDRAALCAAQVQEPSASCR